MELSAVVSTTCDSDQLGGLLERLKADDDVYETVVVADCGPAEAMGLYDGPDALVVHAPDTGLAEARNIGAREASGGAYAFIDDDCVPGFRWASVLRKHLSGDALAAGGPAMPVFPDGRPWYLPRLFDWLVGCGPYYDGERTVRNTYGCNIAFNAEAFDELNGFDESYGKGAAHGQAEEAELAARMRDRFDRGTVFDPGAHVRHYVSTGDLEPWVLLRRAYEQGEVKAAMGVGDAETTFLREVLRSSANPRDALPAAMYTLAVAAGYMRGVA